MAGMGHYRHDKNVECLSGRRLSVDEGRDSGIPYVFRKESEVHRQSFHTRKSASMIKVMSELEQSRKFGYHKRTSSNELLKQGGHMPL